MDMRENPNYYDVEKPYKSKYLCVKCRKVFKRRLLTDIGKAEGTESKEPKCPDCNSLTYWIGPKFRAPKRDNIQAWNSIRVLMDIGSFNFYGFASDKVQIPETAKSLKDLLIQMKENCLIAMTRWATREYDENNKLQIKYFSDALKKIETHLKEI